MSISPIWTNCPRPTKLQFSYVAFVPLALFLHPAYSEELHQWNCANTSFSSLGIKDLHRAYSLNIRPTRADYFFRPSKVVDLVPSHSQKTMSSPFLTPVPLTSEELQVSFPEGHEHVLLLTLNRPKSLNAMTPTMQADLQRVLQWYDDEPSLWYVRLLNPLFSILSYSLFAFSPRLIFFSLFRCSASVFFLFTFLLFTLPGRVPW